MEVHYVLNVLMKLLSIQKNLVLPCFEPILGKYFKTLRKNVYKRFMPRTNIIYIILHNKDYSYFNILVSSNDIIHFIK